MLLDTCGLIWWTLDPQQLSTPTQTQLKKTSKLYVSTISIAELGIKIKKKQIHLPLSLEEFTKSLSHTNIQILPITQWTILDSLALKWPHTDPADRIIVATAKAEKWPIVTKDKIIQGFYKNTLY